MEKLINALENFKNKNILVVGDIILDKYSWGEIDSLNPEMPAAPKVKIKPDATYTLGGAANVANNITSLDANCVLMGVIGNDENGKKISEICNNNNIKLIKNYNGQPTIMKERIMAHGQQVSRLEYGEWNLKKINGEVEKDILLYLEKDINNFDFIVLSDYDKTIFTKDFSQKIIKLANLKNIPTLVDPKPVNIDFFKNCTIISPNEKEAEKISGIKYGNGSDKLNEMGNRLCKMINSRYAVITCGKDGVFSYDSKIGKSYRIKTMAKEVNDVSGAGDTFAAILSLGLASNLDLPEALKLANYGAGMVVEKVGTATTNINEIKQRIKLDEKLYK